MNAPESVPTTWTAADEAFFRIVARVLPPSFVMGAGVLLAGQDDVRTPDATPASQRTPADLVPVRVRRTP
jgi:hypothetical protein